MFKGTLYYNITISVYVEIILFPWFFILAGVETRRAPPRLVGRRGHCEEICAKMVDVQKIK